MLAAGEQQMGETAVLFGAPKPGRAGAVASAGVRVPGLAGAG